MSRMFRWKTKAKYSFVLLCILTTGAYILIQQNRPSLYGQTMLSQTRSMNTNSLADLNKRETHSILWYNKPKWLPWKYVNDSLSKCEYNNCVMTDDRSRLSSHSAIVFTLTEGLDKHPPLLPTSRPKEQVWVLFYLEPPINIYKYTLMISSEWRSSFNWTMTYRHDADILLPYGVLQTRRNPRNRNYSNIYRRKAKFAAWAVSNCGAASARDEYVYELRRYGVPVDVFGVCGYLGSRKGPQFLALLNANYKFYFAFENSLCKDYVTEKFFQNYNQDIVLVVRGGADYDKLLPSETFIDASKFDSPKALAEHLIKVNSSKDLYTDYLKKKDRYDSLEMNKVTEYTSSYCKLCQKLNGKQEHGNVYNNILEYINKGSYYCVNPTDVNYRIFTPVAILFGSGFCLLIVVLSVYMYIHLPIMVF